MRLSEAIRLGSLAIQNPRAGDSRFCAIGMACVAVGKLRREEFENYGVIREEWSWLALATTMRRTEWNDETFSMSLWAIFDREVMRNKTMTLEALCDQVRAWEDELAAKGINVEQATVAAELTEPASQTQSIEKELDVVGGGA